MLAIGQNTVNRGVGRYLFCCKASIGLLSKGPGFESGCILWIKENLIFILRSNHEMPFIRMKILEISQKNVMSFQNAVGECIRPKRVQVLS